MKNFLILFFFCFAIAGFSQNLVPNPSFEEAVMCPDGGGDVVFAEHWKVFRETPDYFNSCASDSLFSVPKNFLGFQEDSEGQAYMGLFSFLVEDHREMIGVELSSPLQVGNNYYYCFKVSRSRKNVASNKIGIKFLNQPFSDDDTIAWSGSQVYTNNIIVDSLNWTVISGHYIADSSYSYISIGNHFNNNDTDTLRIAGDDQPYYYAYYYLDDVCISQDSSKCEESFHTSIEKNNRSPSATFYENILRIKQGYYLIKQITIIDMLGNIIFKSNDITNEYDLSYLNLKPSIYNVLIETHKSITSIKIITQ
jgi:hypothetical protein